MNPHEAEGSTGFLFRSPDPQQELITGRLLALIPALCYSAVMLWRTNREDEFLKGELEGYSRYTGRVRYRLIPGLW
ncbi:MAG TPA: hypothetical protein VMI06_11650 [Terriglobia bacterium]|nr:hypothetical protein [Terriglobia bacterium]